MSNVEYRKIQAFHATLALALSVVVIANLLAFLFIQDLSNPEGRLILLCGNLLSFVLAHFISQRGMWRVGAYVVFIGHLLMMIAFAISIGGQGTHVLYYTMFVIVWAGYLLSWRGWLGVIGLNIGLIGIYSWIVIDQAILSWWYREAGFFVVIACMLLVMARFYQEKTYDGYIADLANAESNLRTTIEASTEGYFLMDAVCDARGEVVDFRIIEANTAACKQVGMTHDQLVGGLICELFPINTKGGFFEQYKRVYLAGESMAQEYHIPEGLPGAGWYSQQVIKTVRGVVIINRDITELKQKEIDLISRQNRLQSLVETQTHYLIRTDMQGNYTFANRRYLDDFGYTHESIIGVSVMTHVHPDDHTAILQCIEACTKRPGYPVPVSIRKFHKTGQMIWTDWEFASIAHANSEIVEIQGVGINTSWRIEAEQNRLEAERLRMELRQQAELNDIKMRMMERISHEFRTPLSIIRSSADLITRYADRLNDEKRMEKIANINSEIDRLTDMLNDMSLILQRKEKPYLIKRDCDIGALVKSVVESYQDMMNGTRRAVVKIADNLPMVVVDQDQIELVVSNLLSNAIKFSTISEPILIELNYDERDVNLSISDRGIGILPDEQDKVFEPFYRGTNFGEISGMGLGLSVVKRIVNAHEGIILLNSTPGVGTTVMVKLPRTTRKPEDAV